MAYVNNPQAAAFLPQNAAAAAAAAACAVTAPPAPQTVAAPGAVASPTTAAPSPATAASSLALLNMSNLINQKDSRWLQLEVCREFQRNKCSRCDTECKFAHPTSNVEVQNGRVTACYDSIKVRKIRFDFLLVSLHMLLKAFSEIGWTICYFSNHGGLQKQS